MASSRQLLFNPAQYFRPKPPSLKIAEEISRGAYGSVHSGELDGRPVAVKRIHHLLLEAAKGQGDFDKVMTDFKEECQLIEQMDHPHLVDFRGGFYDETTDEPVIVMERMSENLGEYLQRNGSNVSRQKELEICLGIACCLRLLHTHTFPIVHGDLTDKNVMFGNDGLVKIGDLGQSKLKANNAEYFNTAQPGAIPFMPPEVLEEQLKPNEKVDIFSLGVLMLEIVTQQPPRVGMASISSDKEFHRRKENFSKLEENHPLKPLILSCLKDDPNERPDSVTIHTQLLAMVDGVEEVLPQSPLHPSLGKEVHSIKLPDMPMGAVSASATIHNKNVYITGTYCKNRELHDCVLVYSTHVHKWSTLPALSSASAIAIVNRCITLIGGCNISTTKVTKTLSSWHEEEGQWKQVLPPMPTGRKYPTVASRDKLLLVTGGVAEDDSTVLKTTDILDLTTMKWTTPERLELPLPLCIHHLAFCGEYLYLVGGSTIFPLESPEQYNSQAWRAKWSDIKDTPSMQSSQLRRSVWTQIADPPSVLSVAVSCGGTLYTVGGSARDDKPLRGVYAYDTAINQWVSVGDMSVGRYFHCAVPLSSRSVFVAGGEIYDEACRKFAEGSALVEQLML